MILQTSIIMFQPLIFFWGVENVESLVPEISKNIQFVHTYRPVVATQICFIFILIPGEMESNLTSIFFKWVGSTTN